MPKQANKSTNPVRDIREAVGESQSVFAKRLGIGLRSLKRYEADQKLPRTEAVVRILRKLADENKINL